MDTGLVIGEWFKVKKAKVQVKVTRLDSDGSKNQQIMVSICIKKSFFRWTEKGFSGSRSKVASEIVDWLNEQNLEHPSISLILDDMGDQIEKLAAVPQ
ncbi:hypothetical protein A3K34_02665 [candidate division WWE3 bacterium RIFOXYC1_FULL_40_10]|uniref:Uncharacterized protein n=1 Tax=candidate division WWE3 bacterium RIFOXYA2_FULL_46_9 TaxID=1802636 RepID=A0A1F4W2U2_UNCKA|nr:MAG: hypothetical protein A3K58_02665 [candidate division WWE3 bacterium RIFOXYB1_FULL_40_22]OGC61749.1 MAG: hypothetical protein A3K37_02665 [candidate division WWE3 bacterium RIFOXYA1_FULL_40_11]OGC63732.1 MAG: hypothetical protein A2264_05155 [candidate division WWE3 bacterium RIFOXYA2_FULL_46_9]OGC65201.1 MAG: hypothetical protein A2326_02485 [candidate division WWE3 bacterium RIFOXYB2_FULL_41_6]OGC66132.1 MAG: hypothetical protein A3K34_02665 [candidate division WWE3 bacterium RIFOXYC1_